MHIDALEIVGEITEIETIASGSGIRILPLLRKRYGKARWRKLKGIANVACPRLAEVH